MADELGAIQAALEPGESLLAMSYFTVPVVTGSIQTIPKYTVVLTRRYIHLFTFKISLKKDYKLTGHSMIPVSKVSGVSTVEGKPLLGAKTITLTIIWDGGREVLISKQYDTATEFVGALKELCMKQEVQQGSAGIADELGKLAQLTQEGILTNEELARAKDMLLGRPQNSVDQSMSLLRNLNELRKQGVLSEMEFNMKKWDILAKQDY